ALGGELAEWRRQVPVVLTPVDQAGRVLAVELMVLASDVVKNDRSHARRGCGGRERSVGRGSHRRIGRSGYWGVGRSGYWCVGRSGDWGVGRSGYWGVGRSGHWGVGRWRGRSAVVDHEVVEVGVPAVRAAHGHVGA